MPTSKKNSLVLTTAALAAVGAWLGSHRPASRAPPLLPSSTAATPTPAAALPVVVTAPERTPPRSKGLLREILASPDAAATAALALPAESRLAAAEEILTALADRPGEAVRIAERFCREDRAFVREHGNTLIAVLTAAREHERAVSFAAAGGPERSEWLARAFQGWIESAPVVAAGTALAFEGDDASPPAFAAWAERDPRALARFAAQSPAAQAAARDALNALLAAPDPGTATAPR